MLLVTLVPGNRLLVTLVTVKPRYGEGFSVAMGRGSVSGNRNIE